MLYHVYVCFVGFGNPKPHLRPLEFLLFAFGTCPLEKCQFSIILANICQYSMNIWQFGAYLVLSPPTVLRTVPTALRTYRKVLLHGSTGLLFVWGVSHIGPLCKREGRDGKTQIIVITNIAQISYTCVATAQIAQTCYMHKPYSHVVQIAVL